MTLRIGIDARAAAEEKGGRGTMVRELLAALARSSAPHRFELYARTAWHGAALDGRFRWRLTRQGDPWWNVRAGAGAHEACDVFLSTNSYLTAWFTRVPTVLVVCDLVAFDDALAPQRRARLIERATLPLAVRRADRIAAISRATADDLARRFPAAATKTAVTPLAADPAFATAPATDAPELVERHGITRPYVLAVGTLEPRKNLPRLIEAFAALPAGLRAAHELVLVGATGWQTDATLQAIAAHDDAVRALGHVSEPDLRGLYRGAALFAYPSLYEGFGLPVLEAMTAGVPVVTSHVSSLPEVAGDAALYCDPRDVGSIRDALALGLTDRVLARELVERGRARAAVFSWERHVAETLALIEDAARRRAGTRAATGAGARRGRRARA
jgi:alpha-1,3-rhamnosyl/mannosyltransferase